MTDKVYDLDKFPGIRCGWFKGIIVKIFGNKFVHDDVDVIVTIYFWRGDAYVMKMEEK